MVTELYYTGQTVCHCSTSHARRKTQLDTTRNTFCGTCYLPHSQVHNERTVPIIMAGCIAHARNGRISTSGLKSDVTIVFFDSDFFDDKEISAICIHLRQLDIGLLNICMNFQDVLA